MWSRTGVRRAAVAAMITAVALAGVLLGVLLAARTEADVGPFRAEMKITPSLYGDTDVQVPPLGSLSVDSHDGPAHLTIQLGSLDQRRTQELVNDPNGVTRASDTALTDIESGLTRLVLRTAGAAVLGALLLAAIVFRDVRRVAWAGGLALAVVAGTLGLALATFRPKSIEEPRYTGMLAYAPTVVGDARRIADRYDEYRAQLQRLVRNVSRLYATFSALPAFDPDPSTLRVLHVSDLHLNPAAWSVIDTVVEQFDIDVVVDTGDITDWGTEQEAAYFLSAIGTLKVPYVFIRGNHDSSLTSAAVAKQRNAVVLEDEVKSVAGLTFAGIGDPRFTPDKQTSPAGSGESQRTIEEVLGAGTDLARTIRRAGRGVDIALVHDPASAGGLAGEVPLVLAGHTHKREVRRMAIAGANPADPRTLLMIEGSTGGAGLRGLEPEQPTPLALSVLYFDQERSLLAYDDISVGGTGQATVSLERHIIEKAPEPNSAPTPAGN
ncbi:MAG TPA: metallophosphoesterase [Micromonosporaceae bacterium]|nr:metallophosphoesterase [Micromonosporaceae bacterium]